MGLNDFFSFQIKFSFSFSFLGLVKKMWVKKVKVVFYGGSNIG